MAEDWVGAGVVEGPDLEMGWGRIPDRSRADRKVVPWGSWWVMGGEEEVARDAGEAAIDEGVIRAAVPRVELGRTVLGLVRAPESPRFVITAVRADTWAWSCLIICRSCPTSWVGPWTTGDWDDAWGGG